ncbi:MAG: VOC family protein [Acidimicrobiia bacterium]|nr:VOC family protein [Acidimicrobiia bacterium]
MSTTVGQYCIYVSDIEASIRFYTDLIGLVLQGRTEIEGVHEAHLAADAGGGRLQLAQRYEGGKPIEHGFALWKTYMNVDDCAAVHDRVVAAGFVSTMAPTRLDRWPVTVAFVEDPDGYTIELIERHDP